MKRTVCAIACLCGAATPAAGQHLELHVGLGLVTDRNAGVQAELPAARGPGLMGTVVGQLARFEGELTATGARLHLPSTAPTTGAQTFGQLEARVRYRVVGALAIEAGLVGRSLSPDPNGEAVGFASVGAFGQWQVTRAAWVWGRLAYVPWAGFAGGGGTGFAAETHLGLEVAITQQIRGTAAYGFQRLDRSLVEPDGTTVSAPVEHDVLRLGIRWTPVSPPSTDGRTR